MSGRDHDDERLAVVQEPVGYPGVLDRIPGARKCGDPALVTSSFACGGTPHSPARTHAGLRNQRNGEGSNQVSESTLP